MLLEKDLKFQQKNRMGDTPLHFACAAGFSDGVSSLLKAKADPWTTNNSRATPLHCAVSSGRADIVAQLRAIGREQFSKNVNAQTRQGDTALHWAAAKVQLRVVETLRHRFSADSASGSRARSIAIWMERETRDKPVERPTGPRGGREAAVSLQVWEQSVAGGKVESKGTDDIQ